MSMRVARLLTLLTLLIAVPAGCERPEETIDLSHLPDQVPGSAVVRGVVRLEGAAPVMQVIGRSCADNATPVIDETVVLNDDGTLRNVVVWLEDGPATDGTKCPAVTIDLRDCRFDPHVVVVQIGQVVEVTSHDPKPHNVHCTPQRNRSRNLALVGTGHKAQTAFAAEEFVRVRCDIHPWMNAWVAVVATPFHALTTDGGRFEITGVPAGRYTLATWHEQYGVQRQTIELIDEQTLDLEFTYRVP